MTDLNSINLTTNSVANVGAKKGTENIAEKVVTQLPQMTEIPSAALGRDLVKPVSIIKAGDAILEAAFDAETKGGKATFTLANGTEVFPDLWSAEGNMYTPKKGDIILGYGDAQLEWGIKHPVVLKEMEEKGVTSYVDRAVSSEPEIMYQTYKGADGRNFAEVPLKPSETVAAEKKIFPTRFLFAEPGTMVETLEAREGSGKMPKVGNFQYIQIDAKGNPYVKDIQDLTKRLNPTTEESKGIFAEVKSLIEKRSNLLKSGANEETLAKVWQETLPKLIKRIH